MTIIENIKNIDRFILYIYFYFFVMPWNFEKWQMGVLSVIMFIWWIIKYKKEILDKFKTIIEFKPLLLMIIFILYSYIAALWSQDISDGLKAVNKFYKYHFLIIPVLFTSLNINQVKISIKIMLISFASYSIFSIMIYLGAFSISETGSDSSNPKGIMAYAIASALMAVGALCSFILMLFEKDNKKKMFFGFISLLCFFALFINNGRTAQVAFLLASFSTIIFYYRKQLFSLKKLLFIILLVFSLFFSSIYFLIKIDKINDFKVAYSETKKVFVENKYEGDFGLRIYFNKIGLDILKEYFIFGMGPVDNGDELEKRMKQDTSYTYGVYTTSFHSSHMDILTKNGIVGYLLLILSIVFLLYKLRNDKTIFYIALSFFFVVFYSSLANVMLIKKPFNYVFISFFILFSVYGYYLQKDQNNEKTNSIK